MNTLFISDTCGHHGDLSIPYGDMIIHAGNVTSNGTQDEVKSFMSWFSALRYRYRIFIAGVNDILFEQEPGLIQRMLPPNVIYLENAGAECAGFKIWGTPYNSFNHGSAFSIGNKQEIVERWENIPDETSIVIGRTPAFGIHDEDEGGGHCGSKELLRRLVRIEPDYFACGNVNGTKRSTRRHNINFINASLLNQELKITHKPVFVVNP